MISVILYIVACIMLVITAFGWATYRDRYLWGWLGMAIWLFTWQILPHL